MAKKGTSFRLSEEGIELISDLSEKLGISQADIVEMSVRLSAATFADASDGWPLSERGVQAIKAWGQQQIEEQMQRK